MKVYISGKISGSPIEQVREKFAHAEEQIRVLGCDPVSPLDNGLSEFDTWEDHMIADIRIMFGCDAIYLLADWEGSKGARIEHVIAKEHGLQIWHQPVCRRFTGQAKQKE